MRKCLCWGQTHTSVELSSEEVRAGLLRYQPQLFQYSSQTIQTSNTAYRQQISNSKYNNVIKSHSPLLNSASNNKLSYINHSDAHGLSVNYKNQSAINGQTYNHKSGINGSAYNYNNQLSRSPFKDMHQIQINNNSIAQNMNNELNTVRNNTSNQFSDRNKIVERQNKQLDQYQLINLQQQAKKIYKQKKITSRYLPDSGFKKYFDRQCFENYGRQNTRDDNVKFLSGNYLKTHNINPHTGRAVPLSQNQFIQAFVQARLHSSSTNKRVISPHKLKSLQKNNHISIIKSKTNKHNNTQENKSPKKNNKKQENKSPKKNNIQSEQTNDLSPEKDSNNQKGYNGVKQSFQEIVINNQNSLENKQYGNHQQFEQNIPQLMKKRDEAIKQVNKCSELALREQAQGNYQQAQFYQEQCDNWKETVRSLTQQLNV